MTKRRQHRKHAACAAGSGAAVGGAVALKLGKVGLAGAFGGVSVGVATFVAAGAVVGLAGYGLWRALRR